MTPHGRSRCCRVSCSNCCTQGRHRLRRSITATCRSVTFRSPPLKLSRTVANGAHGLFWERSPRGWLTAAACAAAGCSAAGRVAAGSAASAATNRELLGTGLASSHRCRITSAAGRG